MPFARIVPPRWRQLTHEISSFAIIGVINTVVHFAVYNGFLKIGVIKAATIATVVATTVSYALNRQWTFKGRGSGSLRREYVLFFVFNIIGLAIQSAILGAAKYILGFTEQEHRLIFNLAMAFGIGVAMVFRFWAYRTFVFIQPKADAAPADAAELDDATLAEAPVSPAPAERAAKHAGELAGSRSR